MKFEYRGYIIRPTISERKDKRFSVRVDAEQSDALGNVTILPSDLPGTFATEAEARDAAVERGKEKIDAEIARGEPSPAHK